MTSDDVNEHSRPAAVASSTTEGEAEVAQAKLRAYGVEAVLDDQIEGGGAEGARAPAGASTCQAYCART